VAVQLNLLADIPADTPVTARAVFSDRLDDAPVPAAVLSALTFEGKADQLQVLPVDGAVVVVVGLGELAAVRPAGLRKAGAQLTRALKKFPAAVVAVPADLAAARGAAGADTETITGPDADTAAAVSAAEVQALTEGLLLAGYEYTDQRSEPSKTALATLDLVVPSDEARAGAERGRVLAEAVFVVRDLVNEPGGSLTPRRLARTAATLGRANGFDVTIYKRKQLAEMGMGGVLGVNRGSSQPPRFVELHYRPEGECRGTVALVGKGITFDSGGLSLKTAAGMMTMKCDMAGAAAVLGAFVALGRLQPDVEVRGYLPLTDNMTGGDATRPGDVFTLRNGKTIEVLNTDAEGRLILADALSLASEARPDAIIDLATLTGACVTALGTKLAGLMGRNDAWLTQVEAAAAASGEQVWRLPLPPEYRKQYESSVADMKNIGNGQGGALVAGLILGEFVADGLPWAHLDIAGPAFTESEDAEITKGGTGFGVRLLIELVERFTPPVA
jgi:leucyl aminopeptidase